VAAPIIALRKKKKTVQLLYFGSTCHRLIRAAFMASPAVEWGVGHDGCWGSSFLCRPDETIFPFGALALWPLVSAGSGCCRQRNQRRREAAGRSWRQGDAGGRRAHGRGRVAVPPRVPPARGFGWLASAPLGWPVDDGR